MFKLVVLFALVAVAVAKPGHLYGGLTYSVAAPIAVPAAVSHSYRTDVVSKPVIATYASPAYVSAPIVQNTYIAAPALTAYATPLAYGAHVPSIHAW